MNFAYSLWYILIYNDLFSNPFFAQIFVRGFWEGGPDRLRGVHVRLRDEAAGARAPLRARVPLKMRR